MKKFVHFTICSYHACLLIFLQSVVGFDMTTLLHSDARNVLNLLLLHLSTHKLRVLAGVKIMAGIKKDVHVESEELIVST